MYLLCGAGLYISIVYAVYSCDSSTGDGERKIESERERGGGGEVGRRERGVTQTEKERGRDRQNCYGYQLI